jgi:hypothetical protein
VNRPELLRAGSAIRQAPRPRRIEFAPENILVLGAGLIVATGFGCAVGYIAYLVIAAIMGGVA